MNERFKKFLQKLKSPTWKFLIPVYAFTLIFIALSLVMVIIGFEGKWYEVFAYVSFGFAGITLAYTVYTVVKVVPTAKASVMRFLESKPLTDRLLKSYGFRTIVFAVGTFTLSLAYSVFNGAMGIVYRSIWYGALAAYYIILAVMRGGILLYHSKRRGGATDELSQLYTYRRCGVLLLIVNVALSSAMAQMIFDDRAFTYAGWTIYAFAAYAFFKITMSILNFFKAKKEAEYTVEAIRNINLTDATVSILALQTALLGTFSTAEVDVSLFNTLTACAVTVITVGLGVYMLGKANKRLKEIQEENKNGEQGI
ncbi:MAG: hypothetical protein IJX88_05355 [Clostridia bacterium]|nr:hypothetical protein [Clostridia bacterium]